MFADLQNKGVRCWFAPQDMKTGDRIRKALEGAIRMRDKLLVILSETSITKPWVIHEIEEALDEETRRHSTVLFPIRLDDAILEHDAGLSQCEVDTSVTFAPGKQLPTTSRRSTG